MQGMRVLATISIKNVFRNKFAMKKASTTSIGWLQKKKTANLFGFYVHLFHSYITNSIEHN